MNLGKLYKRLLRDLTAKPKKAAILGVMLLIAGYFWAPLLMGALGKKKANKAVATADQLILTDDPVDATQPTRRSANAFRWERARHAIATDAAMKPAELDPAWRNPFALFAASIAVSSQESPTGKPVESIVAAPPLPELTPAEAGLVLQGVLIGRGRRVATINGEIYREGETIPPATAAAAGFKIVRISKQGVELECGDRAHVLEFAKSKLAPGDEIVRGSSEK